jgi:glycosyltransferase involved in cell wall biosynthesis
MSPVYSVIICTRNRSSVLSRVLKNHADLCGSYSQPFEFILVDNASTDSTREVIQEFASAMPCSVRYVQESRAGHSFALNAGCRNALGERLIFTDDDAIPHPLWFASLHQAFENQGADWVFGPVIPLWEYGTQPSWYGPETSMFLACFDLGNRMLVDDQLTGTFVGANHACKRDRIFQLGLYDENLGVRGDGQSFAGNDDDLFHKAKRAGFKIVYVPEASVKHIIAKKRYSKQNHRGNSWIVGRNQYAVFSQVVESKKILGLPRYYLPIFAKHLKQYAIATLTGKKSLAFFHEIQAIRFTSLYWTALRYMLGIAN